MQSRMLNLLGIAAGRGAQTPGAEEGPYALREAGLVARLTAAGIEVDDLGNISGVHETRFGNPEPRNLHHLANILQVNRHTHACVLGTLRKSPYSFLLVVGGDHSLAIGTLAGLSDACDRLGLLWIDAHADFNTPESSPSGNIHGMSLAVACGYGNRQLRAIADRDPLVEEADVHLFGPRDIDPGEAAALRGSEIHWQTTAQWRAAGLIPAALAAIDDLRRRCDHIHLSFDIDVLDLAHVPGTGTPVAGGLRPEEALDLLRALGSTGYVESAEFVEYNPEIDVEGRTGRLTIDLIEALVTSRPAD